MNQSKKTVEARIRQGNTIFDQVLESRGISWGGNIDGFLLSDQLFNPIAVIEIRQSRTWDVKNYDPAKFFLGTNNKGGDFKTWLPLIFIKKAYNLPVILITLSTKSPDIFGFTEVNTISNKKLYYVNEVSPTQNVTGDLEKFKKWINEQVIKN